MSLKELLPAAEHVSALLASDVIETRRPGRLTKVSPDLVLLLRSPATVDIRKPSLGEADARLIEDNLAPIKGIMFAVALCVLFWAGISALVWAALR